MGHKRTLELLTTEDAKETFPAHTYRFRPAAAGRSVSPVYGELVGDRGRRLENAFQLDLFSNITPHMGIHFNLQGKDDVDT